LAGVTLLSSSLPTQAQVYDYDRAAGVLAQFNQPELPTVSGAAPAPVARPSEVVSVTAEFKAGAGDSTARLHVTAKMQTGWHIYSTTQAPGGPVATTIKLEPSNDYELTGEFQAQTEPHADISDIFGGLVVEEHEGEVTWTAPIQLAAGVDPAQLKISGTVKAQACNATGCLPPKNFSFVATQAAPEMPGAEIYKAANSHTTLRGRLTPAVAAPGTTVTLELTAEPAPGWHVYARADRDPKLGSKPALISVNTKPGWQVSRPVTDAPVIEAPSKFNAGEVERYHEQAVTWTVEIEAPGDATPGEYPISGLIGYQSCDENGCDPPRAARFAVDLTLATSSGDGQAPLTFKAAKYNEAAEAVEKISLVAESTAAAFAGVDALELAGQLALGLLAGFILNFMPCVLPVIGLKIMSFVHQAGESRGRVFALNLWYVFGLISVFMMLATLAVFAGQGWGAQFQNVAFTISLTAMVFVFALSFLGVWEIPIPGFVGTGKANELAAQEGPAGAFFKGMLTTVLATPCTGPLLIPVLTWAISQPAAVTYAVFGSIGLGMASPYLVIGAFPKLVGFLPKPGAWMETFKQSMGFVLLATVIWLFWTMKSTPEYFIPTLAFLFGLWAACWWIGRTPLTANLGAKLKAWSVAAVFAALVGSLAFGLEATELPWQPYSRAALEQHRANGATVLVDFTADW
jgi:thiol:disulfide interchange protein